MAVRRTWWALLLIIIGSVASAAPPHRPNLLLIVLDTLRYDATSLGDSTGRSTPFLASLQGRSVVFTRAYSTHDFTPPSHFSMLTGLRDGLGTRDDHAENGAPYQLARSGYATFGTIANALLSRSQMPVLRPITSFNEVGEGLPGTSIDAMNDSLAIRQRLALFGCLPTQHNISMLYYSSERLLPLFAAQIRAARPPYFGFVNLIDAHDPYVPDPADYAPEASLPRNFSGDLFLRPLGAELAHPETIADGKRRTYIAEKIRITGSARTVATDLSPQALAAYRSRYLATVRELDRRLETTFAALEAAHLLDDTIVVITSDHGESFGEADLITHNFHDRGDYESTHHVPLLVVLPPRYRPKTHRVTDRVSIADLAPTLYDLAGLDWSPLKQSFGASFGRSLVPLFMDVPARVARATPPLRGETDHSGEQEERRAAMRSLGYIGH